MRVLLFTIPYFILVIADRMQDSPHGADLNIRCVVCHSPRGWDLDQEIYSFNHNTTELPLEGLHTSVDCKLCHPTLIFSEAAADCFSCHTDMHNQTVGVDCARCHTPKSWIVENITDIHRESRFPLQGPHQLAGCMDCHNSASNLQFEPIGVECIDCHMQDYQSATNPNHVSGNISTACADCHLMTAFVWGGAGYNHSFFPLTQGHNIFDCKECHTASDYESISTECVSCHQADYDATTNPNHVTADLSVDCMECHTTSPGWKPADFKIHDAQFFPVFSGEHRGEWDSCTDCHDNPANYSVFTCIDCHKHRRAKMDDKHSGENGYEYTSLACLDCHPTGEED